VGLQEAFGIVEGREVEVHAQMVMKEMTWVSMNNRIMISCGWELQMQRRLKIARKKVQEKKR
jgi:hypothetical protein